jgi:hypothetical protein
MRTKKVSQVLVQAILNRDSLMFIGDPGVGKSEIVDQAVSFIERGFADGSIPQPSWIKTKAIKSLFIHAVISDPTDAKGLPFVVVSKEGKSEAVFLPFGDLLEMINANYLLVVVLDDFGQAPALVQASFMQIVRARRINGHTISDGVVFVACTNKRGDNAGVQGILEPMKDRFMSLINVESHWQDWCEWATLSGRVKPEVIAYHRWCGNNDKDKNHLSNFRPTREMTRSPSPRAWEYMSGILSHNYPLDCLREMFVGAVGEEEGNAFYSFLSQYRDLVHPDVILSNPEQADIPTNPSVLWSVLTALVARVNSKTFPAISKYAGRLAPEWSVFLMTDCARKDSTIKKTKPFVEWSIKHSDVQI